ncbi:MAG: DNA topoisomerase VI subunit B [Candidatus Aenigmarchaeota archaeon]|nr:DNA topoisomerase VI subunit B [Candidatus Aenigmarchaeota archaeon]
MTEEKTAEYFASQQKEISVSQFFEKNKHLLGFDNPTKALLMVVKEAVDNSLDACEEAGIIPDIEVVVKNVGDDNYKVSVKDNGPGIVKTQIPKIFGKLLYGSKFHRLKQSRGQQGIGISAAVLFCQLMTGKPTKIWSKTGKNKKTHYFELLINSRDNEPEIIKQEDLDSPLIKEHGTKIEMLIIGRYRRKRGIDDYLKQTSISNPFAKIKYRGPDGKTIIFPRTVNKLPKAAKEIKPHPYGVEFGVLDRMLKETKAKSLVSFLTREFSSIGTKSAGDICKIAGIKRSVLPNSLKRNEIKKLLAAMQKVKVQRPPIDCISPIGESEFKKSLEKEYPEAEFVTTVTREPAVYRGTPFQIEVGIVYGVGEDKPVDVLRFANRVPLLYQAGAGAIVEAIKETDWKRYGLKQSLGNLPSGPVIIAVHMASSWVPFISESKEAIAPYPNIVKEIKLALQDAGRKLSSFLSGKRRAGQQKRRLQIFERYAPEVARALSELTGKKQKEIEKKILSLTRKNIKIEDSGDGNG